MAGTREPLLSLIIPVYRVEDYLAQCLDSVLHQPFTDIEVIAVDDASDDRSGEILARYAEQDDRVAVVTHDRNRGLGAARNSGLARATGTYVWFVDSDDWLPPGTVEAVAERLRATRPDLLVTGFARVHPNGRMVHSPVGRIAGGAPVPETFTLADQPGLIKVLHIACNKVVRRQFLADLGVTFGDGWYEDVSFSFPLMVAAERISILDRYCYAYRQRPTGAITHTVSERHFDVFDHWERVFAFLTRRPQTPASLYGLIFQRMIWHYLEVLGHARRVPTALRREFFAQISAHYREHRPSTGYARPPGIAGVKHRLVALGAYRLFEALRAVRRLRRGLTVRPEQPALTARPEQPALTVPEQPGERSIAINVGAGGFTR